MSIFKSTFSESVKGQLAARQKAMTDRTPQALSYINSRNAWIRISSSVNVDGTNDLAKKYVLQGGTQNYSYNAKNNTYTQTNKSGIGSSFDNAYSTGGTGNNAYRLGTRPMPGITSIDVRSLGAYGSLREVTVNFQCWDIKQLEDLEVLYMRPGYTMLIEWGWAPYLDNNNKYHSDFYKYYDIVSANSTRNRTALFKELYNKSVEFDGNYEAMFGYIKNYQWTARMDGGYDCQTVVVSTGEIIESLKINYLLSNKIETIDQGLLKDEFSSVGKTNTQWIQAYQKNILAGIWAEMSYKLRDPEATKVVGGKSAISTGGYASLDIPLATINPNPDCLSCGGYQAYISLETMVNILNKYIIAKSTTDGESLIKLSVYSSDIPSGSLVEPLYCTAHPLQVSVDPSVCLIKNPNWYGKDGTSVVLDTAKETVATSDFTGVADEAFKLIKKGYEGTTLNPTDEVSLLAGIQKITNLDIFGRVETLIAKDGAYSNLQAVLKEELVDGIGNGDLDDLATTKSIKKHLETIDGLTVTITPSTQTVIDEVKQSAKIVENGISDVKIENKKAGQSTVAAQNTILEKASKALSNLDFLNMLALDYFYSGKSKTGGDPLSEIGIIGNIYINVEYLYQQAISSNLESSDSKGKNEINLLGYLKKIMSDVQATIGNVSNFEIHVDPTDNNVGRIIDVNYTEPIKAAYDSLFELQVHNLDSIVRSYSLESQMFPDQGAMIAIGAQVKGGQLGIQNNTMIDFNRNLTDRIITGKVDGLQSKLPTVENNIPTVTNGIAQIVSLFAALSAPTKDSSNSADTTIVKSDFSYSTLAANAKNALHDVIAYFQTIVKSPGSNRNLIPTKFSAELDGIGGLIIGHMFRLPKNVMPRGYRGEGIGSELGNAITSIGHSIQNGDWVTKIDSLNIVMNDPDIPGNFGDLDLETLKTILTVAVGGGVTGGNVEIAKDTVAKFGNVDSNIPAYGRSILDMLAYTEGTAGKGQNGYDVRFNNILVPGWNENYTGGHPQTSIKSGGLDSSATGRYQFLYEPWLAVNNRQNVPINKVNQDKAGWKAVLGRISEDDAKVAYDLAISGVTDVSQNIPFLKMLGKGLGRFLKKGDKLPSGYNGLSWGWASIPNNNSNFNGGYNYPGQSSNRGTIDIYNIYLNAVSKNGGTGVVVPSISNKPSQKSNTNYIGLANNLFTAMDGCGTDFNKIKTTLNSFKELGSYSFPTYAV